MALDHYGLEQNVAMSNILKTGNKVTLFMAWNKIDCFFLQIAVVSQCFSSNRSFLLFLEWSVP